MHTLRPLPLYAALLIAALATILHGQQTPSSMPPPTVLQANANLVLVDVVVTEHGSAIHGLGKDVFHVLEDGHEQPITIFEEHTPIETATTVSRPTLPLGTYTNVPAYPQVAVVNVLLLDGLNTPLANQMDVRHRMIEYMSEIKPGTLLTIFTLSSRLRLISGLTTDVPRLIKALQLSRSNPQSSVVSDPNSTDALGSEADTMAQLGASPNSVAGMQKFEAELIAYQTDERVGMTMDAMQQLARYLSGIPGRKNLIWFSGSFPISLNPDTTLPDPFSAVRNYTDKVRATSELLAAARVAVYPVDARGLQGPASMDVPRTKDVSRPKPMYSTAGKRANAASPNSITSGDQKSPHQAGDEHAFMKEIAEDTGGQAYVDTNGLKEAAAKAIENGSNYYTLGYVPAAQQPDSKFHKIEVRTGNHYSLAYRRGYRADAAPGNLAHTLAQSSLIAEATLPGAPPATEIRFEARVLPVSDAIFGGVKFPEGHAGEMSKDLKGPTQRYVVDLKIDPQTVSFRDAPEGAHQASLEFVLIATDAESRRVNYSDRSYQLTFKPDQFTRTMASTFPVRLELDLPTGQIALRIAVHDFAAGRIGSLEVPLLVQSK
jgi:VWFA-related protein